jgi:hypothetical protein
MMRDDRYHAAARCIDELVDGHAAATVPPLSVLLERRPPRLVGGAAEDLVVHLSFHSSCVMCCCRHSRLQNAASPLQIERQTG